MGDKIFKCMICSAMDSTTMRLRKGAVETISHWNSINTKSRNISFVADGQGIGTVPGVGKSSQEVIDTQSVKTSDFGIFIFNTSKGTATKKADSGTLDELKSFLKAKKNIYVFIKSTTELEEIKKEIQSIGTVYYEKYKSANELFIKIRDVLDCTANQYSENTNQTTAETVSQAHKVFTIRKEPYANVYSIIQNAKEGITISNIFDKTGYNRQRIHYILKDLEQNGMITKKTVMEKRGTANYSVNSYSIY